MKQYTLEDYERKRKKHNQVMKDYYYRKKEQKRIKAEQLAQAKLEELKGENENVSRD